MKLDKHIGVFKLVAMCGLFVFCTVYGNGQRYIYDFDQCGLSEVSGLLGDAVAFGNPQCDCGPANESLEFNGSGDYLEMPLPGSLLQQDNYTFSFYIRPSGSGSSVQQIFTNERNCSDVDSIFSVQYFPSIQTVAFRLGDFGATKGLIEGALDPLKCWQQVTLVKQGRILLLYINGIQESRFDGNLPINIYSDEPLRVAYTSCSLGQNVTAFAGHLDEIRWYDRALSSAEVMSDYLPIDEIITGDTLIFLGDQFVPRVSSTCASNVAWSPTNGLSSGNVIDPSIGPAVTTFYNVTFSYSGCRAEDSLNVVVIDRDEIDCTNLLLPSAFTPNGDNLNDTYGFSNAFIIDELLQFDIADRMGNTLFSAESSQEEWDGLYRGKVMPSGPYIYKVAYMCKGEEYTKAGSFTILR